MRVGFLVHVGHLTVPQMGKGLLNNDTLMTQKSQLHHYHMEDLISVYDFGLNMTFTIILKLYMKYNDQ